MQRSRALLTTALGLFAAGAFGCNLQIEQMFAMQPGSGADVALVSPDGTTEIPQGRLNFEGGVVMQIAISTDLIDYLDGTVDGDVTIVDLLFGVPGFNFLIVNTGLVCVVLDDPPGGGTFSYNALAQQATFDVLVNTKALLTKQSFAKLIRGGAFLFPFDLESTIPLTLVDAIGLFSGTGTLTVTQALDEFYQTAIVVVKDDPSQDQVYTLHVTGEVTLQSTDTFPATTNVLACVDYLGT
jgi:hypothetical protein